MNNAAIAPALARKRNDAQQLTDRLDGLRNSISGLRNRLFELQEGVFGSEPHPDGDEAAGKPAVPTCLFPRAEGALRDCEHDLKAAHELVDRLISRLLLRD